MVCLDEMGPQAARSFPGQQLITPAAPQAERVRQEIDYGRRGSGYVFGAFQPASGAALTHTYDRRTKTNWVDFLSEVEAWIDPTIERIYAVAGPSGNAGGDTTSAPTAHRMFCCSACSIPAGSSSSSPSMRLFASDRAVVESLALLGAEGAPVRDLG